MGYRRNDSGQRFRERTSVRVLAAAWEASRVGMGFRRRTAGACLRATTKAGQTYRLFLEDVNGEDSASRRAALFDVLNTLHDNEGQLVITSSLPVPEFRCQYGENLFWRITQHCTVIDLFREKQTN